MSDAHREQRPKGGRADRAAKRGWFGRQSLRSQLMMAFMAQTVAVALAVFALMYTASEDDLEDVSTQLRAELSERIRQKVASYVSDPVAINVLNTDLFRSGYLSLDDHRAATRVFWKQMTVYSAVAYISAGTRDGHFFGIKRMADGTLQLRISNPSTGGALQSWSLDDQGGPVKLVGSKPNYDPRKRGWYLDGASRTETTWSAIESYYSTPNELAVGPVTPMIRGGEVLGVLTTDLRLGELSRYMRKLEIGKTGVAVVVDGAGTLVGSSTAYPITGQVDGETRPMNARTSGDPRIRKAIARVDDELGGPQTVEHPVHLMDQVDGDAFVTVVPLGQGYGLDWVIIISVPTDDVMGEIRSGRHRTVLLCLVALGIALLLALGISRSVTDPLLALAAWAGRISEGALEHQVHPGGGREINSLTSTMNEMVDGLRDRDFIHDAFGRYLSPELMDKFMGDPTALRLGGQRQEVTILMSDLRGFTGLSERLGPEEMVLLLNRYLGRMTDVIFAHRGTIIEFIGDAILVLFGAPLEGDDDPQRAVRCAIEMQRAMVGFNAEMADDEVPVLKMGIAVNTGEVVAGNIGSERHVKYGVVGEPVNLTARLESLAFGGEVLLSDSTYALVENAVGVERPRSVRVKGVTEAVTVYRLLGMGDYRVPDWGADLLIETDLAAELYRIDHVVVDDVPVPARVVRLGERYFDAVCDTALAPSDKYRLRIQLPNGHWTTATYANVTHEDVTPARAHPDRVPVRLGFTSIKHADRVAIGEFRAAAPEQVPASNESD